MQDISLDSEYVKIFLIKWFESGDRHFGIKRNVYPDNFSEIIMYIKRCIMTNKPAFHSIQSAMTLTKIFWEFDTDLVIETPSFDSPELDPVWDETMRLVERIENIGAKPLITYSGNRGFHVWVFISPDLKPFCEISMNLGKRLYKKLLYQILGDRDTYKYFDRVPTHVNTMARIPFSFHQKSGNQVIPVNQNRELYTPDLDEFYNSPISFDYIDFFVPIVVKEITNAKAKRDQYSHEKFNKPSTIRPYLVAAIHAPGATHYTRLAYTMDALWAGHTNEQIHAVFATTMSYYNIDLTEYHIQYERERMEDGMRPYTNKTLREWGIKIPKKQEITVFDAKTDK